MVTIADCPPGDRAEIERCIETHRCALVVRVGALLGSEASRYMLWHRKVYGALPAYDRVPVER